MGYGEYLEWLAGEGLDTSYAGNGINPFKDRREIEEDDEYDGPEEIEDEEGDV